MDMTKEGLIAWWKERVTRLGVLVHQRAHRRTHAHEEINEVGYYGVQASDNNETLAQLQTMHPG